MASFHSTITIHNDKTTTIIITAKLLSEEESWIVILSCMLSCEAWLHCVLLCEEEYCCYLLLLYHHRYLCCFGCDYYCCCFIIVYGDSGVEWSHLLPSFSLLIIVFLLCHPCSCYCYYSCCRSRFAMLGFHLIYLSVCLFFHQELLLLLAHSGWVPHHTIDKKEIRGICLFVCLAVCLCVA